MQTTAFTSSAIAPRTAVRSSSSRSQSAKRCPVVIRAAQNDSSFETVAKKAIAAAVAGLILASPLSSNASPLFLARQDNVLDSAANFSPKDPKKQRELLQETTGRQPREADVEPSQAATFNQNDSPTNRMEGFQPYVPEDVKSERGATFQKLVGKRPGAGVEGDTAGQRDPTKRNSTADNF